MNKHTQQITNRITPNGFVASSPFFYNIKIEKGVILKKISVWLLGTFTFAGGTASGTSTGENPYGLIDKIEIDAVPKSGGKFPGGKLVSCSPRPLVRMRNFDRGSYQVDLNLGAGGVVGAAASYILAGEIPIQFSLPGLEMPDDMGLRLDEFESITIKVTTATLVTILVGNDRTQTLNTGYIELVEDREYAPGFMPVGTLYQSDVPVAISGASTRFSIDSQLPKGDAYIEALLTAETTSKVLSDAIINQVEARSGSDSIRTMSKFQIKGEQLTKVTDQAASMTGLYYLNFAKRGRLGNAMYGVSFICDVANPGTDLINVYTRRFQPRVDK